MGGQDKSYGTIRQDQFVDVSVYYGSFVKHSMDTLATLRYNSIW